MKSSNLYRIHPVEKILQAVTEINFADFKFKERYDIQEWIESTPEILGEELLIIAKEFNYFDNTKERPDLIALDKSGNVVIIELKRDDSGSSMEWQAIKYASYFSKFTVANLLDAYIYYLEKKSNQESLTLDEIKQRILDFIEIDDLNSLNKNQRIILASHRFAREVTSAAHWLIDKNGLDIKVVQLIPYHDKDKDTHYLQTNIILPIPGEEDLIIQAKGKMETGKNLGIGPVRKNDSITSFFEKMKDELFKKLDYSITPNKYSRWAGVGGNLRYYHFWYNTSPWDNWNLGYKVWQFDDAYSKKERRGNFGVFLEFVPQHLLNKGVTESNIKAIREFCKSYTSHNFQYKETNVSFWLEKLIPNNGLNDAQMILLVDCLTKLINDTKSKIDKLLVQE